MVLILRAIVPRPSGRAMPVGAALSWGGCLRPLHGWHASARPARPACAPRCRPGRPACPCASVPSACCPGLLAAPALRCTGGLRRMNEKSRLRRSLFKDCYGFDIARHLAQAIRQGHACGGGLVMGWMPAALGRWHAPRAQSCRPLAPFAARTALRRTMLGAFCGLRWGPLSADRAAGPGGQGGVLADA